jgi:hypothetical protein
VIGLVGPTDEVGVVEVAGDHDGGPCLPNHTGDISAQRKPVFDHAVGVSKEPDIRHADHRGGRALFAFSQWASIFGHHVVDAGFTAGGHAVSNGLALTCPPGDCRCGAVLQVIGMRYYGERFLPVLIDVLSGGSSVAVVVALPDPGDIGLLAGLCAVLDVHGGLMWR